MVIFISLCPSSGSTLDIVIIFNNIRFGSFLSHANNMPLMQRCPSNADPLCPRTNNELGETSSS